MPWRRGRRKTGWRCGCGSKSASTGPQKFTPGNKPGANFHAGVCYTRVHEVGSLQSRACKLSRGLLGPVGLPEPPALTPLPGADGETKSCRVRGCMVELLGSNCFKTAVASPGGRRYIECAGPFFVRRRLSYRRGAVIPPPACNREFSSRGHPLSVVRLSCPPPLLRRVSRTGTGYTITVLMITPHGKPPG